MPYERRCGRLRPCMCVCTTLVHNVHVFACMRSHIDHMRRCVRSHGTEPPYRSKWYCVRRREEVIYIELVPLKFDDQFDVELTLLCEWVIWCMIYVDVLRFFGSCTWTFDSNSTDLVTFCEILPSFNTFAARILENDFFSLKTSRQHFGSLQLTRITIARIIGNGVQC